MKKQWLLAAILMLGALVSFTSCDDDDDGTKVIDVPDYGMQITGTATDDVAFLVDVPQMAEPSSSWQTKEVQNGMTYGIHWLAAGDFTVKNITADEEIVYGVSAAEDVTQEAESVEAFSYKKASLTAGGTGDFSVASAGLYYIILDNVNMKLWVVPIDKFELSSGSNTIATLDAGDATGATYVASGVDVRGSFKVRINTAWKLVFEDIPYAGASAADFSGDHARPVISYGGALDALSEEGSDISVDNGGQLLNFTYTWNPAKAGIEGITVATEAGGELPRTDYSDYSMGFIGNAVWEASKEDWNAWDVSVLPQLPTQDGDIYTWAWESVIIADTTGGSTFKFRKNEAWDFTRGFNDVTMAGAAAADFFVASDDGNFGVAAEKSYDFTLTVDAAGDIWTLTASEAGGPANTWAIIGAVVDGTNWDTDTPMEYSASAGTFTFTGDLVAGDFKFRANGSWDVQYGSDGADGLSNDGGSGNLTIAEAGNYTIVLDPEAPSYTVTKN